MVTISKFKHIPEAEVRNKSDKKAIDLGMTWDESRGNAVISFCQKFVYPTRGISADQQIKLIDWQEEGIRRWASWIKPDNYRRFRKGCLFCPRQQGKSLFGVCLSLWMWLRDGEKGSYVICTAVQRSQVEKVWFNEIWNSYQNWPEQARKAVSPKPSTLTLYYQQGNGILQGLSCEGWGKLGAPPHYAQLEEIAFWGDYKPLTAIETGMKSRKQPFLLAVSTSGVDRTTPAYDMWLHGQAVLDSAVTDCDFFPLIFASKPEDDIHVSETWKKSNPSIGITVPEDEYRKESELAKRSKIKELEMRQFSLNQWVSSTNQFLNLDKFRDCTVAEFPNLEGLDCWVGLDQSSSGGDLTAVVWIVFHQGRLYVQHHAWVSRAGVERVHQSQNLQKYDRWEQESWMTIHEGNTVDYDDMRDFIRNLCNTYKVQSIALDPSHNANDTYLILKSEGWPVEPYGTNSTNMNEPMRRLSDMVDNQVLAHRGDELLTWQAQNLESKKNSMEMLMPHKSSEAGKIDTMLGLLYAIAVYVRGQVKQEEEQFVISWA